MPLTARRYTVDEVLAFPPDGNRYELVAGELLVTPSPSQPHQLVLGELHWALFTYLRPHRHLGRLFMAPADIIWSPDDYVQPDLLVVPTSEVTGNWRDCQNLLLAAEVSSPSSARYDRVTKRQLYQERNVLTYWVVDPDARLVEVWHPADERPQIVTGTLTWQPSDDIAPLVVALGGVFAAAAPVQASLG
jgi:Uma2 family endonuclease